MHHTDHKLLFKVVLVVGIVIAFISLFLGYVFGSFICAVAFWISLLVTSGVCFAIKRFEKAIQSFEDADKYASKCRTMEDELQEREEMYLEAQRLETAGDAGDFQIKNRGNRWIAAVSSGMTKTGIVWWVIIEVVLICILSWVCMGVLGDFEIHDGVLTRYRGIHKSAVIPSGVTKIGDWAFHDCIFLKKVTIPEGVTEIGDGAFRFCDFLTDVTIPDSVTKIGDSAFIGCSSLKKVTIPEGVTEIGDWAFRGCFSLTDVTIPDSVTKIGKWAFFGCSSLKRVAIPDSVTEIGSRAFCDCPAVPFELCITDGVLESYKGMCPEELVIPDGVTEIGRWAFHSCSSLKKVTIPDSVTEIGAEAFLNCSSLKKVTIPSGVTEIGWYVFSGCESLKEINIPSEVEEIGEGTFSRCKSLKRVTIPDSVEEIGEDAFDGCPCERWVKENYGHLYKG